ncbi:Dyp-type peroxidase family [Rhizoctonia solani]|uniref:Dyp-type peroxidase family n=1 Tax=Rhizoctonia solani TaxID=456999 RepID=A0A8H8NZY5_9AGAM|nr:Dyp-type peroxidase family [Rhizoctonia solani]QRW21167.1 Dyp-type peroxidase family [Rhizoctonia solani]
MTTKQFIFTHTSECTNKDFRSEVDLDDIQGDVVVQFPKRVKILFSLRSVMELYAGFETPDVLKQGQLVCAEKLGDPMEDGKPKEWIDEFKKQHDQIHGILLIAGDSDSTLQKFRDDVKLALGNNAEVIYELRGQVRPGANKVGLPDFICGSVNLSFVLQGHEHFGWKDEAERGNILVGHPGDNDRTSSDKSKAFKRPGWAKNGSYMAFRQYDQLVPEFHKWTVDNAIDLKIPGMSPDQLREKGAALRAAQLVGRWPSGTPLELSPHEDNLSIASNPKRVNDFLFKPDDQTKCPFSAHIRKLNPRVDYSNSDNDRLKFNFGENSIIRAGIAYGPEVEPEENKEHKTRHSRGLAFVAYQNDIIQGFQLQQTAWANNTEFPPTKHNGPNFDFWGLDPLIGQNQQSQPAEARVTTDNVGNSVNIGRFIIPRGGAYFFVPPLQTLKQLCAVHM